MVIESSPVKAVPAAPAATTPVKSVPASKPGVMAAKSPAARSTPRRSGGGDADGAIVHSGALKVEIIEDVANRSSGEDSNVSSGSGGSAVDMRGPRGEEELDSRSITIQSKR